MPEYICIHCNRPIENREAIYFPFHFYCYPEYLKIVNKVRNYFT